MNVKEDSENASFKLNIQKAKIGGGPKMAEEQDGEITFSPTNLSKEHLNAE